MQQTSSLPLPVLQLSQWHRGGLARQQFTQELGRAARDYGFFYLTEHGIDVQTQQQVMATTQAFFRLPMAAKQQVSMLHSPHFRGYTRVGGELTNGLADQREQFDLMQEEAVITNPRHDWQQLIGPNQWPTALPEMRAQMLDWQQQLTTISTVLLEAFACALQQPPSVFADSLGAQPYTHMKLIRYPKRQQAAQSQGVGAHKDPGYLTLVMQDQASGLEVAYQDRWLSVVPLPGAFVVNIGELLELASDGYLKATYHRVISPEHAEERFSNAFFMAARLDAEVPLLELPPALKAQAQGPASDPANPLFRQVGKNVLKGRARSHPEVAQRYYITARAPD